MMYGLDFISIKLPSGRSLYYPKPFLKLNQFEKDALHYYGVNQTTKKWEVNSTYGVLNKAAKQLKEQGLKIDTMHIRQIYPVAQAVRDTFDKYRKIYIVEHNHNKQLRTVIASKYHNSEKIGSLLKYDGDIYYTHELVEQLLEEEK